MNIAFLTTYVPNPRLNKRITVAKKVGNVTVICARRVTSDIWEPFHTDVHHDIISMDLPPSKQVYKRFKASRRFESEAMLLLIQHCPDCIFTAGLEALDVAVRYQRKHSTVRILYEVADLRELYISSPKSLFMKTCKALIVSKETHLLRQVDHLILTSEMFYNRYYQNLIHRDKVLIIPNLPDMQYFKNFRRKDDGPFTIGFIGAIRYMDQMKLLVDAASQCGAQVLFAGKGNITDDSEIRAYCQDKPFVHFFGAYEFESQIASLYSKVDCVYSVYNADNPNVRIALPNKLYEAIYCRLPILVAKDTYLAELVARLDVGLAVSHKDVEDVKRAILTFMQENTQQRIAASCEQAINTLFTTENENALYSALDSIRVATSS